MRRARRISVILLSIAAVVAQGRAGPLAPPSASPTEAPREKTTGTAGAPAIAASDWPAIRDRAFDEVWQTVNDAYFDPTFGGVDWAAVREKYRPQVAQAKDQAALLQRLQAMLNELHRTHFSIVPREAAVFTPAERVRIGTSGARIARVEDQVVVVKVRPDSPAAKAGLRAGDAVLALNGYTMHQLGAALKESGMPASRVAYYLANYVESGLRRPVGTTIALRVAGMDGVERDVTVTCAQHDGAWSEPLGNFPSLPIEITATRSADGVDVLAFNVFTPSLMKTIRTFLRHTVKPGDGLVIDLRGNGGGVTVMATGISGWLTTQEFSLGSMTLRDGHITFPVFPQEGAFTGPIAILIDSGSASTSEILAAGLQENGRARVFGELSAGAALPSSFKTLATGDLFQFAIADMKTPKGELIEGRGVTPNEEVRRTRAGVAAGTDEVLDAATTWLKRERLKHR